MHTLQTGWCFYAGLESAKRSNVWLASQSPAALSMAAAAGQLPCMPGPHTPQRPPPSPSAPEPLLQVAFPELYFPHEMEMSIHAHQHTHMYTLALLWRDCVCHPPSC